MLIICLSLPPKDVQRSTKGSTVSLTVTGCLIFLASNSTAFFKSEQYNVVITPNIAKSLKQPHGIIIF